MLKTDFNDDLDRSRKELKGLKLSKYVTSLIQCIKGVILCDTCCACPLIDKRALKLSSLGEKQKY